LAQLLEIPVCDLSPVQASEILDNITHSELREIIDSLQEQIQQGGDLVRYSLEEHPKRLDLVF